jgi:ABC-type multidrug transport system fused ATPase/permease subunit
LFYATHVRTYNGYCNQLCVGLGAGLKLGSVQGNVELRDITFVYPARPEVTVFSHFDLKVPAGQTVALVGQSGSGKYALVFGQATLDKHTCNNVRILHRLAR